MTSVRCPYCNQLLSAQGVTGLLRCTECGNVFDTDASSSPAPAIHAPQRLITRLTEPYRCHQCNGAVLEPAGLQRSTRDCPLCHKITSIYARLYYCPECGTLLESPAVAEGKRFNCPHCGRALTVPRELAFQRSDDDTDWFAYPCPSCDKLLHSQRDCAREVTFCPACRHVLTIPDYGFAELPQARHRLYKREALVHRPMRRCPRCGMTIPRQAGACPYCSPRS